MQRIHGCTASTWRPLGNVHPMGGRLTVHQTSVMETPARADVAGDQDDEATIRQQVRWDPSSHSRTAPPHTTEYSTGRVERRRAVFAAPHAKPLSPFQYGTVSGNAREQMLDQREHSTCTEVARGGPSVVALRNSVCRVEIDHSIGAFFSTYFFRNLPWIAYATQIITPGFFSGGYTMTAKRNLSYGHSIHQKHNDLLQQPRGDSWTEYTHVREAEGAGRMTKRSQPQGTKIRTRTGGDTPNNTCARTLVPTCQSPNQATQSRKQKNNAKLGVGKKKKN